MEEIKLHSFQDAALQAIQKAIMQGQKRIVIDMPTGTGKGLVLNKTVEHLNQLNVGQILIVTEITALKEQIIRRLYKCQALSNNQVYVETKQKVLRLSNEEIKKFRYIIFFDIANIERLFNKLLCENKSVIVFSLTKNEFFKNAFEPKDIVFSYTYQQAVEDGFITPAMDKQALGIAFEIFCKRLMENYGYTKVEDLPSSQSSVWDIVMQQRNQKLWIECKNYKSQVLSPSTANDVLKTIISRKQKQKIADNDIILLMVLSKIPSFQKDEIYKRFGIIVLDIDNLVFYCKDNPLLLKQLSQVTYFPINYIEGQSSAEADHAQLFIFSNDIRQPILEEDDETDELIHCLKNCPTGNKNSQEYEKICEKIIRILFEANYFNRLTPQHKTNDNHFRMDLIGSLKINQSNEESMHPLWQMFVQHYNTHFIVFEFKNYAEEIDQNLIYITEKYLFNAALRNVAFIISREGFSDSAKFAAEGCLKEHGKLIIDITDKDLIEMLELKSDKAADHILDKVEGFLMGISK